MSPLRQRNLTYVPANNGLKSAVGVGLFRGINPAAIDMSSQESWKSSSQNSLSAYGYLDHTDSIDRDSDFHRYLRLHPIQIPRMDEEFNSITDLRVCLRDDLTSTMSLALLG